MILTAHGIEVTLPPRWSGRIFRRAGGNATLHAGDFRLALGDGEFGDRSTGQMPPGSTFLALVEYLPGAGLEPGRGLYAPRSIPLPLDPTAFSSRRLAHVRPGQTGMQHFFTTAGRPLCLYVVIAAAQAPAARAPAARAPAAQAPAARAPGAQRRRQLAAVSAVLGSVRVVAAGGITSRPA